MSEKSFNIILSNREGGPELFKEIAANNNLDRLYRVSRREEIRRKFQAGQFHLAHAARPMRLTSS